MTHTDYNINQDDINPNVNPNGCSFKLTKANFNSEIHVFLLEKDRPKTNGYLERCHGSLLLNLLFKKKKQDLWAHAIGPT